MERRGAALGHRTEEFVVALHAGSREISVDVIGI
jgi:hypothetical protein